MSIAEQFAEAIERAPKPASFLPAVLQLAIESAPTRSQKKTHRMLLVTVRDGDGETCAAAYYGGIERYRHVARFMTEFAKAQRWVIEKLDLVEPGAPMGGFDAACRYLAAKGIK